jgi:hypothetical protein
VASKFCPRENKAAASALAAAQPLSSVGCGEVDLPLLKPGMPELNKSPVIAAIEIN